MILYEFEGKDLLKKYGILVPRSQLLSSPADNIELGAPLVVKAQVLSGKRQAVEGILFAGNPREVSFAVSSLWGKTVYREQVSRILIEQQISYTREYYLSISYDTTQRTPVVTYSDAGGAGIENRKTLTFPINILNGEPAYSLVSIYPPVRDTISKLIRLFLDQDATLAEINPLGFDGEEPVALDCKIKLDDTAMARHPDRAYPPRAVPGYTPSAREIAAKKIDAHDYRGTAGSAYFDLPGDIAVFASGGGASLTAMDALLAAGGHPADYTEYSGNPPREKVEQLTRIVLSKPKLHGLWVVGAVANFTDIFETLSGFLAALRRIEPRPKFPIVIRRGGPRDQEAFAMLKQVTDFDLHVYGKDTSISESAQIIADLASKYALASSKR